MRVDGDVVVAGLRPSARCRLRRRRATRASTSSTAAHPGCSTARASTAISSAAMAAMSAARTLSSDGDAADHPVRRHRLVDRPAEGVGQDQRDQRERADRPDGRGQRCGLDRPVAADVEEPVALRRGQPGGGQQPADGQRGREVEDRLHRRQRQFGELTGGRQPGYRHPGRDDRGERGGDAPGDGGGGDDDGRHRPGVVAAGGLFDSGIDSLIDTWIDGSIVRATIIAGHGRRTTDQLARCHVTGVGRCPLRHDFTIRPRPRRPVHLHSSRSERSTARVSLTSDGVGRVAAEQITPTRPGIPAILPGRTDHRRHGRPALQPEPPAWCCPTPPTPIWSTIRVTTSHPRRAADRILGTRRVKPPPGRSQRWYRPLPQPASRTATSRRPLGPGDLG